MSDVAISATTLVFNNFNNNLTLSFDFFDKNIASTPANPPSLMRDPNRPFDNQLLETSSLYIRPLH